MTTWKVINSDGRIIQFDANDVSALFTDRIRKTDYTVSLKPQYSTETEYRVKIICINELLKIDAHMYNEIRKEKELYFPS